jgi:hypothetical protein
MTTRQVLTATEIERKCIKELAMRGICIAERVVIVPRAGNASSWEVGRVILKDGKNVISEDLRGWLKRGRPLIQDLQRTLVLKEDEAAPREPIAAE